MEQKKHGKVNEDPLDAEDFLQGIDLPEESDWSLEEILAEFDAQREPAQPPVPVPERRPPAAPVREERAAAPPEPASPAGPAAPPEQVEQAVEAAAEPEQTPAPEARPQLELFLPEDALPKPPRPISVEEVVGRTVDHLMSEQEPLREAPPRRALFSRRRIEDTETLYGPPEPEPEPEPPEPEPPLRDVAEAYRRARARLQAPLPGALLLAALLVGLMAVDYAGLEVPYWTGEPMVQTGVLLTAEAVVCLLGRSVFARGFRSLFRGRCTPDLMISLSCLASAADCASRPFLEGRCAAAPFVGVSCVALCFALWGGQREAAALYDCYRTAAVDDEPPYLVTDIPEGACKQRGSNAGFFHMAESDSLYARRMAVLLPVVLAATVVFGVLSSVGQRRNQDFLWCWSAILTAASTFSLPLAYSLPFFKLARRLQKSGSAAAGYAGAERVCRKRAMILTDTDLFPPGTLTLNGMKLYAETLDKAVSYAASLARASGSGLVRLFDGLMQSEGGRPEKVDDFSFYEEGGVSGNIHGETALLGTASFLRKMDVHLPSDIRLRTGVFLAVDRQLIAVFAVKYLASENVEWALRSMRRGRITPILAVRDSNITPALIKRKFGQRVKAEYPELSKRLALSEQETGSGRPDALLFREGLMPYAETVSGSRRYSRAARRCTYLSLLGSVAGTLLAFYLTFSAAYTALTPLAMLVFLLLWTLPTLLLSGWVNRF